MNSRGRRQSYRIVQKLVEKPEVYDRIHNRQPDHVLSHSTPVHTIINFMEQNPSQANCSLDVQEIRRILWNTKPYYVIHKFPHSQINRTHALPVVFL